MFLHLCVILFTGGLCPGGLYPGGYLSRGGGGLFSREGVSVQGVSVQGNICPGEGGLCSGRGYLSRGISVRETPLYSNVQAVHLLLEYILVTECTPVNISISAKSNNFFPVNDPKLINHRLIFYIYVL